MTSKFARIALTAVVLLSAFGGLLCVLAAAGCGLLQARRRSDGQPGSMERKSLQLHGFVAKGTWGQKPNTLEYEFKVENKGSIVHAYYTGVLPDTFKEEAEVVLKAASPTRGTSKSHRTA